MTLQHMQNGALTIHLKATKSKGVMGKTVHKKTVHTSTDQLLVMRHTRSIFSKASHTPSEAMSTRTPDSGTFTCNGSCIESCSPTTEGRPPSGRIQQAL